MTETENFRDEYFYKSRYCDSSEPVGCAYGLKTNSSIRMRYLYKISKQSKLNDINYLIRTLVEYSVVV